MSLTTVYFKETATTTRDSERKWRRGVVHFTKSLAGYAQQFSLSDCSHARHRPRTLRWNAFLSRGVAPLPLPAVSSSVSILGQKKLRTASCGGDCSSRPKVPQS